jgi:hypothetical protein
MKMNSEQNAKSDKDDSDHMIMQQKSLNASRRRFTKSGLAASGVIMTLACKPVMGKAVVTTSPSGFASMNVSRHGPAPTTFGKSPEFWRNNHSAWSGRITPATRFHDCFPSCSSSSVYYNVDLGSLLHKKPYDLDGLGMYLVAAYLNSVSQLTPFLPPDRVVAIFTEWQSRGYYEPTAAVQWSRAKIVEYLAATQEGSGIGDYSSYEDGDNHSGQS